ncbi:hypothetical protein ACEPAG_7770 [Sanghuangporus baumii]
MVSIRLTFGNAVAVALLYATRHVQAQTYQLRDNFVGRSFLSGFNWETYDPSGGYVNYLDQATSLQKNLTYASDDKFVIRADSTNVVPQGARGRDSNRIVSHKTYADSVLVLDMQHMPGGCAQWPAFWTVDPNNWPGGGEVDIVEGIHMQSNNLASLHTTEGCSMPPQRAQQGSPGDNNCDVGANGDAGCQTSFADGTFGEALNGGGGGYFVMARSASRGIAIYFWNRYDSNVPPEVKYGSDSVTPNDSWGEPQALFPTDNCNFNSHFAPHNIIVNLSFCGPWASPRFNSWGCGSGKCEDYVAYNPSAFSDAYWEINALRVYTP